MSIFILVHSPLVGQYTWVPVGDELRHKGFEVVVPALASTPGTGIPYWQQHANQIADPVISRSLPPRQPLILVGHSGAGALLPAAGQELRRLGRPVSAYIFVDAGIPEDGMSRLDLFPNPDEADRFRQAAKDGLLPTWTDDDLRGAIPDPTTRKRFVSELRPTPLAVYEEPIPVYEGWPDAYCGYLSFTATDPGAYEDAAQLAKREGWAYTEVEGGHFHMLVNPSEVAEALRELAEKEGGKLWQLDTS